MLQRVITASGQILIWGEAGGALDRLTDMLACYEQMLGPGNQLFKHGFGGNGAKEFREFVAAGRQGVHKWIACMNPPLETFTAAIRDFLESAYGRPAADLGYRNWGIKEVQSGTETANLLRLLYPEAYFIFLVRNPIACLTSIKRHNWLDRPQDRKALEYYAGHWLRLAQGFRQSGFGMHVKYEDLVSSKAHQEQLGDYLGISSLPRLFADAEHADWVGMNKNALSYWEKNRLLRLVGEEMTQYGYQ
jgi:hypothetical protein